MQARSVPSRFVAVAQDAGVRGKRALAHARLAKAARITTRKRDVRHRCASTASPSPATRICETASVENHPYLVNTFPRMRPDAESMSHSQHAHVAQRSTPLPSHPALTYASDAEGRSACQTSLSCESR